MNYLKIYLSEHASVTERLSIKLCLWGCLGLHQCHACHFIMLLFGRILSSPVIFLLCQYTGLSLMTPWLLVRYFHFVGQFTLAVYMCAVKITIHFCHHVNTYTFYCRWRSESKLISFKVQPESFAWAPGPWARVICTLRTLYPGMNDRPRYRFNRLVRSEALILNQGQAWVSTDHTSHHGSWLSVILRGCMENYHTAN